MLQDLSAFPVRHRNPADLTLHVGDQDEQALLLRRAPGKQDKANGPPKSRWAAALVPSSASVHWRYSTVAPPLPGSVFPGLRELLRVSRCGQRH